MSFNKCFVPGCTTGCNNTKKKNGNEPGKTLFKTPLNKVLFERWKKNIPRGGVDLIPGCLVCEIHFPEESIIRNFRNPLPDGSVSIIKRSKPVLKPGAVPTIFPNLPPHLYRTLKRVDPPAGISRINKKIKSSDSVAAVSSEPKLISELGIKPPEEKIIDTNPLVNDSEVTSSENDTLSRLCTDNHSATTSENSVSSSTNNNTFKKESMVDPTKSIQVSTSKLKELINKSYDLLPEQIKKSLKNEVVKSITIKETNHQKESKQSNKKIENNKPESPILPNSTSPGRSVVSKQKKSTSRKQSIMPDTTDNFQIIIAQGEVNDSDNNEVLTFRYLKDNIEDVRVPSWHWSCSFLRNSIAFLNWGLQYDIKKKVIVNYDMKYKVFILDREISIEGFDETKSFLDLQNFLQIVDKISVCQGMEKGETKLWSKNCFGFVPPREEGAKRHTRKICDACLLDMKNAPSVQKRDEEKRLKRIQRLSNALNAEKLKNRGLTLMNQKLRKKIEKLNTEQKVCEERVRCSMTVKCSI